MRRISRRGGFVPAATKTTVRFRKCAQCAQIVIVKQRGTLTRTIDSTTMPNSVNAQKALRQSQKRRDHNRQQRSALRTAIKNVRKAAAAGDIESAQTAFRLATKKLDQAAAKNLIHRNTAARTKSRLSHLLKKRSEQAQ